MTRTTDGTDGDSVAVNGRPDRCAEGAGTSDLTAERSVSMTDERVDQSEHATTVSVEFPLVKQLIDEYVQRFGQLDGRVSRVAGRFGANRQLAELLLQAIEANKPPDFDAFAFALAGMTLAQAYDTGARSVESQVAVDRAIEQSGLKVRAPQRE